jgi:hypothetical protein
MTLRKAVGVVRAAGLAITKTITRQIQTGIIPAAIPMKTATMTIQIGIAAEIQSRIAMSGSAIRTVAGSSAASKAQIVLATTAATIPVTEEVPTATPVQAVMAHRMTGSHNSIPEGMILVPTKGMDQAPIIIKVLAQVQTRIRAMDRVPSRIRVMGRVSETNQDTVRALMETSLVTDQVHMETNLAMAQRMETNRDMGIQDMTLTGKEKTSMADKVFMEVSASKAMI